MKTQGVDEQSTCRILGTWPMQPLGIKNRGDGSSGKSFGQSCLCSTFPLGTSHAWCWLLNIL